jgi:hypothetical protein
MSDDLLTDEIPVSSPDQREALMTCFLSRVDSDAWRDPLSVSSRVRV